MRPLINEISVLIRRDWTEIHTRKDHAVYRLGREDSERLNMLLLCMALDFGFWNFEAVCSALCGFLLGI